MLVLPIKGGRCSVDTGFVRLPRDMPSPSILTLYVQNMLRLILPMTRYVEIEAMNPRFGVHSLEASRGCRTATSLSMDISARISPDIMAGV